MSISQSNFPPDERAQMPMSTNTSSSSGSQPISIEQNVPIVDYNLSTDEKESLEYPFTRKEATADNANSEDKGRQEAQ